MSYIIGKKITSCTSKSLHGKQRDSSWGGGRAYFKLMTVWWGNNTEKYLAYIYTKTWSVSMVRSLNGGNYYLCAYQNMWNSKSDLFCLFSWYFRKQPIILGKATYIKKIMLILVNINIKIFKYINFWYLYHENKAFWIPYIFVSAYITVQP